MRDDRLVKFAREFGAAQRRALLLLSDYCFEVGRGIKNRELDDLFEGDLEYWTDGMSSNVSKAAIQLFVAQARLGYYDSDASAKEKDRWKGASADALDQLEDEARDAA